jgi:hypothetical protein
MKHFVHFQVLLYQPFFDLKISSATVREVSANMLKWRQLSLLKCDLFMHPKNVNIQSIYHWRFQHML